MPNMKALPPGTNELWPMLKFFKLGQRSRSRSHVQNLWYSLKGTLVPNLKALSETETRPKGPLVVHLSTMYHLCDGSARPFLFTDRPEKKTRILEEDVRILLSVKFY